MQVVFVTLPVRNVMRTALLLFLPPSSVDLAGPKRTKHYNHKLLALPQGPSREETLQPEQLWAEQSQTASAIE